MKETILLLAVLAAAIGGYLFRGDRNRADIAAADAARTACADTLASEQAALASIRARLADLDQRHRQALADAERELDLRDDEIQRLSNLATARVLTLRKNAHDDSDCTALVDLAVCASVAGELWDFPPRAAHADPH